MLNHKLNSIKPLPNYEILAEFSDGYRVYDVKPLMTAIPDFMDLKNIAGLFRQVRIDMNGYGIAWNDWLDLSSDTIYYDSKPIKQ